MRTNFLAKPARQWLLRGAALFGMGLISTITQGVITNDESWFLQVVHRMTQGEVLYRQIFFGVTPLSAYLVYLPIAVKAGP